MTTLPPLVLTRPMTQREYDRWSIQPAHTPPPPPPNHKGWAPGIGVLVFCTAVIVLFVFFAAR